LPVQLAPPEGLYPSTLQTATVFRYL